MLAAVETDKVIGTHGSGTAYQNRGLCRPIPESLGGIRALIADRPVGARRSGLAPSRGTGQRGGRGPGRRAWL
jgi:hypothetical protein